MTKPIDFSLLRDKLIASLAAGQLSVETIASDYKACHDAGVDVSDLVPIGGHRLLAIAEGRLSAKLYLQLGHLPSVVEHVSRLPVKRQEALLALEHLTIVRGGKPRDVKLAEARASEIVNAIDPKTGKVRPAALQLMRLPKARPDTHEVRLMVEYPDFQKLVTTAAARGRSIEALILQALRTGEVLLA